METVAHFGWKELNNGFTPKKSDRRKRHLILPYTVYLNGLPDRISVIGVMNDTLTSGLNATISIGVGLAKLHPDDEYIKKVGAVVSQKNEKPEDFGIVGFTVDDGGALALKIINSKYWIEVEYAKTGGAKITHFMEMQ